MPIETHCFRVILTNRLLLKRQDVGNHYVGYFLRLYLGRLPGRPPFVLVDFDRVEPGFLRGGQRRSFDALPDVNTCPIAARWNGNLVAMA